MVSGESVNCDDVIRIDECPDEGVTFFLAEGVFNDLEKELDCVGTTSLCRTIIKLYRMENVVRII